MLLFIIRFLFAIIVSLSVNIVIQAVLFVIFKFVETAAVFKLYFQKLHAPLIRQCNSKI